MKIGFRRKNLKVYFLQLKKLYKESLFIKGGAYSCLAFFSLGMVGVLPVVPPAHISLGTESVSDKQVEPVQSGVKADKSVEERCYWQEDVAQFLALQEKKGGTFQTDVPCKTKPSETTKEGEKKQIVSDFVSDIALGITIRELTEGYPIEQMAPTIATFDREVAALIVGIAKKESNWGKRVPLDTSGADCFNYWGYKGAGTRGVEMGHGCFGSPEEAVMVVGNRLKQLVSVRETSVPASMIIWKCGSSCRGHSDESVQKWISDVALYYDRIAER